MLSRLWGSGSPQNTIQFKTMFLLRASNRFVELKEIQAAIELFKAGKLTSTSFEWCSKIPQIFMNPQFKDQLFLFIITLMRGVFESKVPITLKLSALDNSYICVGEGESAMKFVMNGEINKSAIEIARSQSWLTVQKQYIAGADYILSPEFVCQKSDPKKNAYDIGYIGWSANPLSKFGRFIGFIVDDSECTLGERTLQGKLNCDLGLMITTAGQRALLATGGFKNGAPDGDNVRLQLDPNTVGEYTFRQGKIISARITRTLNNGITLRYSGTCGDDAMPSATEGVLDVFAPNKSLISRYSGNFVGGLSAKTGEVNLYPNVGELQFFVPSNKTENYYSGKFDPESGEIADGPGSWDCTSKNNSVFQVQGKFIRQKLGAAEAMKVGDAKVSCKKSKIQVVVSGDFEIANMRSQSELTGTSQKFQLYGISGRCDSFRYTQNGIELVANGVDGSPMVSYAGKFLDNGVCEETIKIAIPTIGISLAGRFNDPNANNNASMTLGSTVYQGSLTINNGKITFVTMDNVTYEFGLPDIKEKVNPLVQWKEANSSYEYCAKFKDGKPAGDYKINTQHNGKKLVWSGKVKEGILEKDVKIKIGDLEFRSEIVDGKISMTGTGKRPHQPWTAAKFSEGSLIFMEGEASVAVVAGAALYLETSDEPCPYQLSLRDGKRKRIGFEPKIDEVVEVVVPKEPGFTEAVAADSDNRRLSVEAQTELNHAKTVTVASGSDRHSVKIQTDGVDSRVAEIQTELNHVRTVTVASGRDNSLVEIQTDGVSSRAVEVQDDLSSPDVQGHVGGRVGPTPIGVGEDDIQLLQGRASEVDRLNAAPPEIAASGPGRRANFTEIRGKDGVHLPYQRYET